jgi:hypothetical protein
MAKKFEPVTLKKGDREVTATTVVELVQYEYDGYARVEAKKAPAPKNAK